MSNNNLTVATILKPQGIRGEVKVKVFTDNASDLKEFKKVLIDGVAYTPLSVRGFGDIAFITLKGIADRDHAEKLRGKDIEVAREEIPPLPEGRYYIADLIGCSVVTQEGENLGEIIEVTPASTDIYTISKNGKEITFVSADGVVSEVNIKDRKLIVNSKRFEEVSL